MIPIQSNLFSSVWQKTCVMGRQGKGLNSRLWHFTEDCCADPRVVPPQRAESQNSTLPVWADLLAQAWTVYALWSRLASPSCTFHSIHEEISARENTRATLPKIQEEKKTPSQNETAGLPEKFQWFFKISCSETKVHFSLSHSRRGRTDCILRILQINQQCKCKCHKKKLRLEENTLPLFWHVFDRLPGRSSRGALTRSVCRTRWWRTQPSCCTSPDTSASWPGGEGPCRLHQPRPHHRSGYEPHLEAHNPEIGHSYVMASNIQCLVTDGTGTSQTVLFEQQPWRSKYIRALESSKQQTVQTVENRMSISSRSTNFKSLAERFKSQF